MMTSQASKCHDPMYNFDTHFPERLSRLHVHNECPSSFRKKKSRAQRCGSRYKTQPVTFDEITEVDEEPNTDEKPQGEKLKGQLQAFSRSMDGLLPRSNHEQPGGVVHHISHSRSGSRKFHRHPDCIPERVEAESATSPQPQTTHKQQLFGVQPDSSRVSDRTTAPEAAAKPPRPFSAVELQSSGQTAVSSTPSVPVTADAGLSQAPTNMAPRRQKVTAKAKKRQKASEEGQVS